MNHVLSQSAGLTQEKAPGVHRLPEKAADRSFGLSLLERLFPEWIIYQGDQQGYLSGNSAAFFGLAAEEVKRKPFGYFRSRIHPDDLAPYQRIRQRIEAQVREIGPVDIRQHRFVIQYRLRRDNGLYFHVHEEKLFFPDEKGNAENYTLLKDFSDERPFSRVQLDTYRLAGSGYRRISSYVPSLTDQSFTARELEIIGLIKDGLSSKEIADRLFISINTVRNHRSNLFRKTNARNMVDLLNHTVMNEPAA